MKRALARECPSIGVAVLVAIVSVASICAALGPSCAWAKTLAIGTPGHPFRLHGLSRVASAGLNIVGHSDQTLTLDQRVLSSASVPWSVSPGGNGSVQWLTDGSMLVCAGGQVGEINATGSPGWTYTSADGPALVAPTWAQQFTRNGTTYVLIADAGTGHVFAVERDGSAGEPVFDYTGAGAYALSDPICARYLPEGTDGVPAVLIADADPAAPKVIEVGWDNHQVGWHYGGTYGTGAGELMQPTDVDRAADGSILIADSAADRVICIDGESLVWQYGQAGTPSNDDGYLNDPMGVSMEPDGDVAIADTGNDRVLVVHRSADVPNGGARVWTWKPGPGFGPPRLAEPAGGTDAALEGDHVDGALLVCDQSGHIALVGNTGGAQADTATYHLTSGDSQAHWLTLRVRASTPGRSSVVVHYHAADGWSARGYGPGTHSLRGVVSDTVAFVISFNSPDRSRAPSLKDIELTYTTGSSKARASGNGGATNSIGTAAGAGTGTGTGVGGSGNGSAVGSGQGSSTDLGGSGGAAGSGAPSAGATLTVPGPSPLSASSGGAAAGAVTGIPVNTGELAGGAHGGGGGSPAPRASRAAAWLRVGAAIGLLACLLAVAPVIVHRRMHRLGALDHPDELGGWA